MQNTNQNQHSVKSLKKIHAKTLLDVLSSFVAYLAELETYLSKERHAISKRAFGTLETILHEKETVLTQLRQLDERIKPIFNFYQVQPNNNKAFDPIVQNYQGPLHKEIQNAWDITKRSAQRCETFNEINGKVIHHTQNHMSRLLSALSGQSSETKVYHKDGKKQETGPHRSLAKA